MVSESQWNELRQRFRGFLDSIEPAGRNLVVHDMDADGITAEVVLRTGLHRAGYNLLDSYCVGRNRNVWLPENRSAIRSRDPGALFVLDLGSREEQIADGVPLCLIDHHYPEGQPPGSLLLTTYGWDPVPNTSLIVWQLASGIADLSDKTWVAAIGIISDLGDRAPFPLLAEAKERYKAKWLKEATTLVNAARRVDTDLCVPVRELLSSVGSPQELVESSDPRMQRVHEARVYLKKEMDEAKKAAPTFAGEVALIRVSSDTQVHPLIAQIWRSRLPKYYVLVANDRYREGFVHFSARSRGDRSVRELLRSIRLPGEGGELGHGDDHASGGVLPIERWNALLDQLGFERNVQAG